MARPMVRRGGPGRNRRHGKRRGKSSVDRGVVPDVPRGQIAREERTLQTLSRTLQTPGQPAQAGAQGGSPQGSSAREPAPGRRRSVAASSSRSGETFPLVDSSPLNAGPAVPTLRTGRMSMARFLDVHTGMKGLTQEQLMQAHQRDVELQSAEHVTFVEAWADPASGKIFCLSEAPNKDAVKRVHKKAGHATDEIYEVPLTVK
jgi:hypothetical protein